MNRTRIMAALALVAGSGLAMLAPVQWQGVKRTDLQRHDLSVRGREVIQEGSLEYRLDGKPPVTLKPGDVLFVPAGVIHAVRNVGRGNAEELATYLVEKGKPLLVNAK